MVEASQEFLTEAEEAALNAPDTKDDEPVTTTEKVETKETSPPETEVQAEVPPKTVEEPPPEEPVQPPAEGILAKDGRNVIPFSVLEQERFKRQQLESELAELRKQPPEAKVQPQPKVQEPQPEAVDFKTLAEKLYESPEGAAEALKMVFEEGARMAREVSQKSSFEMRFQEKIGELKSQNKWLTGPVEELAFNVAKRKVAENPNFNINDVNDWIKAADEAVKETKELIKPDAKAFDTEAERKKIREEITKEVMQKFNITPAKPTTLSGVRNLSPDIVSKFDQLKALSGIEFEEAFAELTSQEQEAFLRE